jgi:hypothetical protein
MRIADARQPVAWRRRIEPDAADSMANHLSLALLMPDRLHLAGPSGHRLRNVRGFTDFARIRSKRTELLAHRENPPRQPSNRPSPALSGAARSWCCARSSAARRGPPPKVETERIRAAGADLSPMGISLVDFEPKRRTTCGFGRRYAKFPSIENSLAERGEFELPVPISEQPDENMMSGSAAPDEVSGSPEAQTPGQLIRPATFEGDFPLLRDRTTSRLMSQQRSNKRAGHFAPVAPSDSKAH